jgi:DNA/RNA-binding domain of Phe-tRNA-synthetase-like protein
MKSFDQLWDKASNNYVSQKSQLSKDMLDDSAVRQAFADTYKELGTNPAQLAPEAFNLLIDMSSKLNGSRQAYGCEPCRSS